MEKFEAIGMRTKITDPDALIINTCSDNDTSERGTPTRWSWSNPTNRRFEAVHPLDPECRAVSTEAMWQGTKIRVEGGTPDPLTLAGDWRRGKGKKPVGTWMGPNRPLARTPGAGRRAVYIPCFRAQIERWVAEDEQVRAWITQAAQHEGQVFLRDFDTGRGVDRNGPMSHAWVLSVWLNTGEWPV